MSATTHTSSPILIDNIAGLVQRSIDIDRLNFFAGQASLQHQGDELIEWFSPHPLHDQRIAMVEQFADEHRSNQIDTTPLPNWL